ncbi:MAG: LysM peptidoglycan-binding domain-containing protein [Armatimonadota bacterium]
MMELGRLPELRIKLARFRNIRPAVEKYMLFITVLVAALAVACSVVAFSSNNAASAGTVRVTVHQGDSLWTFASQYGNPNEYILKRVHRIARINNIKTSRPLEPGEELIIPCERKTVCASTNRQMP